MSKATKAAGSWFAVAAELGAKVVSLEAERTELRSALEQCLRRLDKLNEGGPDEADPTVVRVREVLAKTQGR